MSARLAWLVRRIVLGVMVVLGAATAAFAAMHLMPGDPVQAMLGQSGRTPELVARVRHDTGLDRPLYEQYGLFLGRLARGDLGTSYQLQETVTELIRSQVWSTVALSLAGFLLAIVIAVPVAVATAARRPALRRLTSTVELVLASVPGFWIGVLLLTVFSFHWQLFPAVGGTGVRGLVLPALTLALTLVGVFTQVLREEMERALREPFVLSSRARGASETTVRLRHALRHALIPLLTLSGWTVGTLLTGAVTIETVFNRPGVGRLLVTAVDSRDFPVISGVVVLSAAVFAVISIGTDWLYTIVDARVREVRT
ncbi:ABC transporter permease [Embleya sp. MST-111070]|uniref:ABC transporter permease n=1 Tax=Embleya sp. MST-111070 TaxID=3398231 RepID=UPI003F73341B